MKLVEKMERSLTEPMQVEELTASIGLSRRQIERLFRNELRCSPARYYLKLRLERAQLLLVQSAMPVVEVAIACGFVSASHFSKCYRETFGCSPQEARGRSIKARSTRPVACASAA
jgi:transcriptional regulator GlxA family with amidase domain